MPKQTSSPTGDTKLAMIRIIFTNLLFVVGVILLIMGFVQSTSTTAKMLLFEKYPLNSYEESRCDMAYLPIKSMAESPVEGQLSEEERAAQQAECKKQLEFDRRVRQTEDIVGSISFLVAGGVLTMVFKRFIWEKLSR